MNVLLRPATSTSRGLLQCSQRVLPSIGGGSSSTTVSWRSLQQTQRSHSLLILAKLPAGAQSRVGMFAVERAVRSQAQQRISRGFSKALAVRRKPEIDEKKPSEKTSVVDVDTRNSATVHENIYTIPNILTFTRLFAAPAIGYYILNDAHQMAFGLFAYAGITDMLDGWIARRWNQRTVVGTIIDPMADKMLMTILTVCLAMKGGLPVWIASIIIGRDVGLAISAIYYRYISLPPPKTFRRYWDFSLPSAEVRPTTISKFNTAFQLGLIGLTVAAPVLPYDLTTGLAYLQYVVAITTIWSGASYIYSKDAVKILSKQTKKA